VRAWFVTATLKVELTGGEFLHLEPQRDSFSEPGFQLVSFVFGVLPASNVSVSVPAPLLASPVTVMGNHSVTYTGRDSVGNVVTATRVVQVADKLPPTITLRGAPTMTISLGSAWSDPGATAEDLVDGSINVTIGGDVVLSNRVGVFNVTYTAQDSRGNVATVVRRVTVTGTQWVSWVVCLSVRFGCVVNMPPHVCLHACVAVRRSDAGVSGQQTGQTVGAPDNSEAFFCGIMCSIMFGALGLVLLSVCCVAFVARSRKRERSLLRAKSSKVIPVQQAAPQGFVSAVPQPSTSAAWAAEPESSSPAAPPAQSQAAPTVAAPSMVGASATGAGSTPASPPQPAQRPESGLSSSDEQVTEALSDVSSADTVDDPSTEVRSPLAEMPQPSAVAAPDQRDTGSGVGSGASPSASSVGSGEGDVPAGQTATPGEPEPRRSFADLIFSDVDTVSDDDDGIEAVPASGPSVNDVRDTGASGVDAEDSKAAAPSVQAGEAEARAPAHASGSAPRTQSWMQDKQGRVQGLLPRLASSFRRKVSSKLRGADA